MNKSLIGKDRDKLKKTCDRLSLKIDLMRKALESCECDLVFNGCSQSYSYYYNTKLVEDALK